MKKETQLTAIPNSEHWLNARLDKTFTGGLLYSRKNSKVEEAGWCVECKETLTACSCGYDGPPPSWAEP